MKKSSYLTIKLGDLPIKSCSYSVKFLTEILMREIESAGMEKHEIDFRDESKVTTLSGKLELEWFRCIDESHFCSILIFLNESKG